MLTPAQIAKAREILPCFGHFGRMNCINSGFLVYKRGRDGIQHFMRCPFENDCKKLSEKYAQDSGGYNEGKIDKPRDWIKGIRNGTWR